MVNQKLQVLPANSIFLIFNFLPSSLKIYLLSDGKSTGELSPEKTCSHSVHFQILLVWLLPMCSIEEKGSNLALEAPHQVACTIPKRSSVQRELRAVVNS